jgi:chromosome segregation ATPase
MSYKEMLINKLMAVTPPEQHEAARVILDGMTVPEVQKAVDEMEHRLDNSPSTETPDQAKTVTLENRIRELEELLVEKGAGERFQEKLEAASKELGDRNDRIVQLEKDFKQLQEENNSLRQQMQDAELRYKRDNNIA